MKAVCQKCWETVYWSARRGTKLADLRCPYCGGVLKSPPRQRTNRTDWRAERLRREVAGREDKYYVTLEKGWGFWMSVLRGPGLLGGERLSRGPLSREGAEKSARRWAKKLGVQYRELTGAGGGGT